MRIIKVSSAGFPPHIIRLAVTRARPGLPGETQGGHFFDLWFPKDERQRVLWPSIVRLSLDYFDSLTRHAVPLDERAIASLSHSAMALDIYAGSRSGFTGSSLASPPFIPWTALKDQFGWHYNRIRDFRRVFARPSIPC